MNLSHAGIDFTDALELMRILEHYPVSKKPHTFSVRRRFGSKLSESVYSGQHDLQDIDQCADRVLARMATMASGGAEVRILLNGGGQATRESHVDHIRAACVTLETDRVLHAAPAAPDVAIHVGDQVTAVWTIKDATQEGYRSLQGLLGSFFGVEPNLSLLASVPLPGFPQHADRTLARMRRLRNDGYAARPLHSIHAPFSEACGRI